MKNWVLFSFLSRKTINKAIGAQIIAHFLATTSSWPLPASFLHHICTIQTT